MVRPVLLGVSSPHLDIWEPHDCKSWRTWAHHLDPTWPHLTPPKKLRLPLTTSMCGHQSDQNLSSFGWYTLHFMTAHVVDPTTNVLGYMKRCLTTAGSRQHGPVAYFFHPANVRAFQGIWNGLVINLVPLLKCTRFSKGHLSLHEIFHPAGMSGWSY